MRPGKPISFEELQKSKWEAIMLTGHTKGYTMLFLSLCIQSIPMTL